MLKIAFFATGGVLIVFGILWTFQGLSIITGGFMAGHRKWVVIGGGLIAVGLFFCGMAARVKKGPL